MRELISFLRPFLIAWMVISFICGLISMKIGKNKGYTANEYFWGFWLGVIGIIVVACRADASRNGYLDSSTYKRELLNKHSVEEAREIMLKNGGWKCAFCGRVSPEYATSCNCGRTAYESKRKFESARNEEPKKSVREIQLEGAKKMFDDGLITEEEYEAKKNKILAEQKAEENSKRKKSVKEIQLEGAKKMLDDGLITEEEYEAKRKKILGI